MSLRPRFSSRDNPGSPPRGWCAVGWKPGSPPRGWCAVGWKPGSPPRGWCAVGWKPGFPARFVRGGVERSGPVVIPRRYATKMRVLVVEDERKLAQVLASALQAEHYDVVVAPTAEDGFFRANAEVFDLIVLDLM